MQTFNEEIREFAHDVRNSLGGIIGYAELMKLDLEDPKLQKKVANILQAANAVNSKISTLVEGSNFLHDQAEEMELNSLVQEVIDKVKEKCDKHNRHQILIESNQSIKIRFNKKGIYQALIHLLIPLVESLQNDQQVKILLEKNSDFASLQVSTGGREIFKLKLPLA